MLPVAEGPDGGSCPACAAACWAMASERRAASWARCVLRLAALMALHLSESLYARSCRAEGTKGGHEGGQRGRRRRQAGETPTGSF